MIDPNSLLRKGEPVYVVLRKLTMVQYDSYYGTIVPCRDLETTTYGAVQRFRMYLWYVGVLHMHSSSILSRI